MEKNVRDLIPGDVIVLGGVERTVKVLDPVLDPRGGVCNDNAVTQWYTVFSDGHAALLSGTLEAA